MKTERVRPTSIAFIVAITTAVAAAQDAGRPAEVSALIVHEWGTFTSIAGRNGEAVEWHPVTGPADLPCFVERDRFNVKASFSGKVRMETPVLYFYAPDNVTVNVSVRFHRGVITEWFPPAAVSVQRRLDPDFEGVITWSNVNVSPGASAEFRREIGSSHYYAARQTDAAPLQSGRDRERFLFYRGVGHFAPPISATLAGDGTTVVWSSRDEAIGDVILFENRGGEMAYEVRHGDRRQLTFEAPASVSESNPPRTELVKILIAHGLYEKEAEAMVRTWSDSWFEEGTRLFYVVSQPFIDAVLPLKIDPRPTGITRVFVGRLELVSPFTQTAITEALATGDRATLDRYGRFLQPIAERVLADTAPAGGARLEEQIRVLSSSLRTADACR
jgi:hypothetical protein